MVSEAYAACLRDARRHYENFPVASVLVPRRARHHIAAVYAFARAADDFADEGRRSVEERHALLDGWLERLHQAARAPEPGPPPRPGEPAHAVPIFIAVGATIRDRGLPVSLFEDLLSAFRQDVTVTRYESWADVLDYCRRSANPVGRLVLRIAGLPRAKSRGHTGDQLDRWSDAICTALQLTNFWQDLHIDYSRGRIYLPAEERRFHGAREEDLTAGQITLAWQQALRAAVRRTRDLFDAGRPLCDAVAGRLRYELRATWLGGVHVLDSLERAQFDVVHHRPRLGARDAVAIAWQTVIW
ncbi:MAG: squalene synthase HpnC [Acidimicrobiia bacterium]|nr:squalene synthase HpnC [Acidimicrobiia bacterium]